MYDNPSKRGIMEGPETLFTISQFQLHLKPLGNIVKDGLKAPVRHHNRLHFYSNLRAVGTRDHPFTDNFFP